MEIIVWSKNGCPQCDMATKYLDLKGIQYQVNKIGDEFTVEDLRNVIPNASSVPQIIIDDLPIGGYKELVQHLKDK